ncbi:hypothetical protein AZE42_07851 [Rhizopogon vesiculosus]|uniref:Uncharacterized protein n=1 Tax=Rhizopogon vesiculosus TaxID=180088 RepID=A0A1J8QA83_9AGAM|nr:hypothetical protein AZE42_07851 [Rhizopogon vesiculosus]
MPGDIHARKLRLNSHLILAASRQSVFQRVGHCRDPYQPQTTGHEEIVTSTVTAPKQQSPILTTTGVACNDAARFWCNQDDAGSDYDLGVPGSWTVSSIDFLLSRRKANGQRITGQDSSTMGSGDRRGGGIKGWSTGYHH